MPVMPTVSKLAHMDESSKDGGSTGRNIAIVCAQFLSEPELWLAS